MPDNTSVTEFIFRVAGTADINAATTAMNGADTIAKQHNATVVGGSQAQVAAIGMTRREWMRTGSEASYYLTLAASKTGALGGQVAQVTGLVTQLGESFMYSTGIGMGIAVIGLAVSAAANIIIRAQEEIRASIKDTLKPVEDLKTALDELEKPSGGIARALYEVAGISKDIAGLMQLAAEKGGLWRDRLYEIESASRKAAQAELDYAEAWRNLQWGTAIAITRGGMAATQAETDAQNKLAISFENAKWKAYGLYWQKRLLIDATIKETDSIKEAVIAQKTYDYNIAQGNKSLKEYLTSLDQYLAILDKIAASMKSQVNQAVSAVIQSTQVTAQEQRRNDLLAKQRDLWGEIDRAAGEGKTGKQRQLESEMQAIEKELAVMGPYKDAWDELARQSDIIVRDGAGRLAEFPKLSAAMKKTGLDAAEFGKQFRSGAIFADFAPWELLGGGVGSGMEKLAKDAMMKLKEVIGTQQLNKAVSDEVWKEMPDSMRDQLRDMGIANLTDAEKIQLGIRKANDFDATLLSIRESLLSAIPPTMYTTIHATWTYDKLGGGLPPGGGIIGNVPRPGSAGPQEDRRPPIIINATVANDMDLERLAYRLGRVYQRR